jgi:tetratricopeptide (TPR) repeat protein
MSAFIRYEPSEEAALAAVGLAQVREGTGSIEAAAALYLRAAYGYAQLGAGFPAAACRAQLGMVLQASGDLLNAAREMHAALAGMDAAFAPSLAARLWLALAEIEATVGDDDAAGDCLRQARTLYPLASTPAEGIERTWREARIAAATGDGAAADVLLDGVRRELLARGSLVEAARSTWEQLLVRTEGRRWEAAGELAAALAGAFPGAGEALAAEMAALARLAAEEPQAFYKESLKFGWRLRHQPLGCLEQPRLLTPTRQLADRLLRRRGELEDPIGAAVNL